MHISALRGYLRRVLAPLPGFGAPAAGLSPSDIAALMPRRALAPDPGWSRVYGAQAADDKLAQQRELAFRALTAPILAPWLSGSWVWLEPGDELSRALLLSGLYEPETMLAVRDLLPPDGVFVDVGAHCGLFSLFAAGCVGAGGIILAFEPSPREFVRLQANLAANSLTQVQAHQAAITDQEGEVVLRLAEPGHAGHNTIGNAFAYDGVLLAATPTVTATTLDRVLADLVRCDVVKIDIEGAELRALRGGSAAIERLRPALVLEVFDRALAGCGATVAELLAWLDTHDYIAHDIDPATARLVELARIAPGESKNIVALPRR